FAALPFSYPVSRLRGRTSAIPNSETLHGSQLSGPCHDHPPRVCPTNEESPETQIHRVRSRGSGRPISENLIKRPFHLRSMLHVTFGSAYYFRTGTCECEQLIDTGLSGKHENRLTRSPCGRRITGNPICGDWIQVCL